MIMMRNVNVKIKAQKSVIKDLNPILHIAINKQKQVILTALRTTTRVVGCSRTQ
jgi:hypothetical protein